MGYAPWMFWIENLPPGVQAEKSVAQPRNTPYKGTCGEDMWTDGTNVELLLTVAEDAPGGFHPIRVRARGEAGGKVVEREAEILFRWGFVGRVYGPTTDQELLATVTDLPAVILETPENLSLAPGSTGRLKVIATRFTEPDSAITLETHSLPSGVTIGEQDHTARHAACRPSDESLGNGRAWQLPPGPMGGKRQIAAR